MAAAANALPAIPFLGTILLLGILIIFFSLLNILPGIFAQIYGDIISTMNKFITWIPDTDLGSRGWVASGRLRYEH